MSKPVNNVGPGNQPQGVQPTKKPPLYAEKPGEKQALISGNYGNVEMNEFKKNHKFSIVPKENLDPSRTSIFEQIIRSIAPGA
jgi:hypothetical protein